MRSCVIGQIRKPFFVDLRQNFAWTRKTSLNGSEKINRKFHCCGILTSTRLLSSGRGSLQAAVLILSFYKPAKSNKVRKNSQLRLTKRTSPTVEHLERRKSKT